MAEPTLSQILVKRDYTQKRPSSLFYKDSPFWQKLLSIGFVGLLTLAGLGDWKTLNLMLGGLPKIFTAGVIAMAMAYAFIYPDVERLKKIIRPALVYMSLMAALLLWSMVIWFTSFSNISTMTRAISKIAFQSISIMTAICGVYLFEDKAIELFTIAVCLANGAIMLLEIPSFGRASSIFLRRFSGQNMPMMKRPFFICATSAI